VAPYSPPNLLTFKTVALVYGGDHYYKEYPDNLQEKLSKGLAAFTGRESSVGTGRSAHAGGYTRNLGPACTLRCFLGSPRGRSVP
jgi:hypothetical protein